MIRSPVSMPDPITSMNVSVAGFTRVVSNTVACGMNAEDFCPGAGSVQQFVFDLQGIEKQQSTVDVALQALEHRSEFA